jgi:glycosyltransferase involved in cell wall biosynthesis
LRVLRVYHAGRDPAHRARERELAALGIDLVLVVPSGWPDPGAESQLSDEIFHTVELPVRRSGDVNRHAYADSRQLSEVIETHRPDVVDIHEEPVSLAARQWLKAAGDLPVTMYTAQNVDKRFPPPFAQWELAAYRRVQALYPCSNQAASVARGKGFRGLVDVIPLGVSADYTAGSQSADDAEVRLGLVGRLVPEKGVIDAVHVLAHLRTTRPARLLVIGKGPERDTAEGTARRLGVLEHVEFLPWQPVDVLAELYRSLHVVLVPSTATATWVEQFGRIIVEGQASGAVIAGYRSGAIPEVAAEGAVLVQEGAVEALAQGVTALMADARRYAAVRRAGLVSSEKTRWSSVAARQALLYEAAATTSTSATAVRDPRRQRVLAREEFGPPARLTAGERPFALPILRGEARWTHAAGLVVDSFTGAARAALSPARRETASPDEAPGSAVG